jgi:hypothetical protein
MMVILGQSQSAGEKAIAKILELRSQREELHSQTRKLRSLHHATKDDEQETRQALSDDLQAAQDALDKTIHQLKISELSLGMPSRRQLEKLQHDAFINAHMNARALKSRIRAKVISQKFERSLLERAYRHHVTRKSILPISELNIYLVILGEKDHKPTKDLLKRGQQSIGTLVGKYNRLVATMEDLKRRRKAPFGARVPRKLNTATLFRLDVDDEIWNEDGLLEEDISNPPGWLANQMIRDAIPAMLDRDRIREETERLDAEEKRLMFWLRYEIMDIQRVLLDFRGKWIYIS